MNYFVVYKLNNKSYVLVNSMSQSHTRIVLEVFDNKEAIQLFFNEFTNHFKSSIFEDRMRATLAMMTTNPVACLVDNPEEISTSILSSEIHVLRCGVPFKSFRGVEVKEDILLRFLDFNIWKDCLKLAGVRE